MTVKDGIVTLAGEPETARLGHEIVRQVRHVQGVVAVRDRLEYPPAVTRRRSRATGPSVLTTSRPAKETPMSMAQDTGRVYALLADGTTVEIRRPAR